MTEKQPDGDGVVDGVCGPATMRRNDEEKLREIQLSIVSSSLVFPGFRFSPTDDELISYYLKKKLEGYDACVDIIPEVDFCHHEPWDLPGLSIIQSNNEWFFFSTRGKKYPNGSQSKRATQSGYWKATGKERNVRSGAVTIGTKRTLVFHVGRAPKGERTEWIMHEYCTTDIRQECLVICRLRRNSDFRLPESSRGSSDHRNLSTTDNNDHSATNEYADTQVDGFDTQADGFDAQVDGFDDRNNVKKSCSKGSSSSCRSRSVGQNDSESESDRQMGHGSPHCSSSRYKDCDNEDDCFADIINDDIIKLDESTSNSFTFYGLLNGSKYTQNSPQQTMLTQTGQETSVKKVKLKCQTGQTHHENPSSDHNQDQNLEKKTSGCVVDVLADNSDSVGWFNPRRLILVLILIIVVVWQGNYLNSKQHMGMGMGMGLKSRLKYWLKYWLRKAADYM